MDKTIRKIKMFAVDGDDFVTLLGEFNNYEDIRINTGSFSKNVLIEFEEYYIGGEDEKI